MNNHPKHFYDFGPFRLDPKERLLLRDGDPIPLAPKVFDTLLALVENTGQLVEKDELLQKVWPDAVVEEHGLSQNIFLLRKVLGESSNGQQYIETVPKRGYRFVGAVKETRDGEAELILQRRTRLRATVEEELHEAIQTKDNETLRHRLRQQTEPVASLLTPMPDTSPVEPAKTRRRVSAFVIEIVLSVVVLSAIAIGLYQFFGKPKASFKKIKITKLTNSGNCRDAALSPDGKFVAYVLDDSGRESVQLRQVNTGNATELVAPTGVRYAALTFSPDGDYLYYVKYEKDSPANALYQIPAIGGNSRKIIPEVHSPISFSPDGKQFCFFRRYRSTLETALITASVNGTQEQELARRKVPDYFSDYPAGPSWSPRGDVIACGVWRGGPPLETSIVGISVKDKTESLISNMKWQMFRGISWLSENTGLLVIASERPKSEGNPLTLWHIRYPDGAIQEISNAVSDYIGISVGANSDAAVTSLRGSLSNICIAPIEDPNRIKYVTSVTGEYYGASATPDGKIIYSAGSGGFKANIWVINPDGTDPKQLTDTDYLSIWPAVSPDAKSIVFASYATRPARLWRMDIDGGNQRQLNERGVMASFSPDGKSLVYQNWNGETFSLYRLSTDGGESVPLTTDKQPSSPSISPDGKLLAYHYRGEKEDSDRGIAIMSLESGALLKRLNKTVAFGGAPSRWTPDGRGIEYIETRGGVSNVWVQPLDGGQPKQLTNFTANQIGWFDWSFDKKQIIYIVNITTSDIVLIESVN